MSEAASAETALGIAVKRTAPQQLHVGVLYKHSGVLAWLHLAWHHQLKNDLLGPAAANGPTVWVSIPIDELRRPAVIALCQLIAGKQQLVPYGLFYRNSAFASDGTLQLGQGECGLTCATFVLAVLSGAGFELLQIDTWPKRDDDAVWQSRITETLQAHCSGQHYEQVRHEAGALRFRPEEVAGSCSVASPPAEFVHAVAAAREIVASIAVD